MSKNTKRIITPGELVEGLILTIFQWKMYALIKDDEGSGISLIDSPEHTLVGTPLRVVAVDLPFMMVDILITGQRFAVDTRLATLMELKEDYIRASLTQEQLNTLFSTQPKPQFALR